MNYKETLELVELKIECLLKDVVEDRPYKSPKTEERLTSLCLGREYLIAKLKENAFFELTNMNIEMINNENEVQEVQNEG